MRRKSSSSPASNDGAETYECPEANELDGLVEMGMKKDALQLARRTFKQKTITAGAFNAALNAVLTQADRTKPWTKLVDSAYARLTKRGQRSAGFLMLAFHCSSHNYGVAQRFLPKRFDGTCGLVELAYAMEMMLALNKMGEAEKLARKFAYWIKFAEKPMMRAMLRSGLADYFARRGEWECAIRLLEELRLDYDFAEKANLGIVQAHLAAAMQEVRKGLESVEKLKSNPDPTLAITLPGNERERWEELQKQLNRLGKQLEKILPKEHWTDLGVDGF